METNTINNSFRVVEEDEAKKIVQDTADLILKVLAFSTQKIHRKQAWLLCGRSLNLVFSSYYGIAISDMEGKLDDLDKEIIEFIKKTKME